jgi:RNA polymerase sigma-70 factor (ECF subfamily)
MDPGLGFGLAQGTSKMRATPWQSDTLAKRGTTKMSLQDRSARPLRLVTFTDEERRHTDAEMVAALRAGQPWAARAIWDRYSVRVHRFLARALGRPTEEVEDLTQEVFLRIFSRAHAIREPGALREFAMSVAVRVLKWELRRRWVRRKVRLSVTGDLPEVVGERGKDEEARHALRRCYRILDALGARERTAFALRYMEEMTLEEVAARMEVSLSTAKRLVGRSSAAVAEQVGGDPDLCGYFLDEGGSRFVP